MTTTRPLLRYHGGKWRLAAWILHYFPMHRVYVEPFGGGASLLLQKHRSHAEVYNDLDGEVVNLFRVARDRGAELARAVELTPFSRDEFAASYLPAECPVEQARRTVIRSFMGFGSAGASGQSTGFRANSNRSHATPAHDWRNYPEALRLVIERLQGVVIENRDAQACMLAHDSPSTLHYVDPPYVHSTRALRTRAPSYRHEMSDDDHRSLLTALCKLQGMVIVSGYRCDLYDELFGGWRRVDKAAMADGARARVESLWLSANVSKACLFEDAA